MIDLDLEDRIEREVIDMLGGEVGLAQIEEELRQAQSVTIMTEAASPITTGAARR